MEAGTASGGGGSAASLIVFAAVCVLIIFICGLIAKRKNISGFVCLWGLLFIVGIIIVCLLPANYVQCKNCGYRYNPKKAVCPVCGHSVLDSSEEKKRQA